MTKFLQKSKIYPTWAKMNFPVKRLLPVFQYSNYLPFCQKSEKTNQQFLRKMTDSSDFIGLSVDIANQFVLLYLRVLIVPHMFSS